ncbi:hypothetical protein F5890DRAFT_1476244 [Lentinula detonsa]|uniref:Uncharacterized protein n=1 Tax=Lentinula detonsa TaxID=2804962 RepID=A0AA38PVH0_9AGAR|nr:hypothetical protein F5890DRAFT_1476244 [Lentinula detonsa]
MDPFAALHPPAPSTYNSHSKRVCSARLPFWIPLNGRTKLVRPGAASTITICACRYSTHGLYHLQTSSLWTRLLRFTRQHHPHTIPTANGSVPLVYPSGFPSTVERNLFGLALPQRSQFVLGATPPTVFTTRKRVHYGLVCCALPASTIHIKFPQQTANGSVPLVYPSGFPSTVERNLFGLALPQRSQFVLGATPPTHHPHKIPAANGSVPLVYLSGFPSTVERNLFGLALPQRSQFVLGATPPTVFTTRKRVHYGLVCCASPTCTIHIQFPPKASMDVPAAPIDFPNIMPEIGIHDSDRESLHQFTTGNTMTQNCGWTDTSSPIQLPHINSFDTNTPISNSRNLEVQHTPRSSLGEAHSTQPTHEDQNHSRMSMSSLLRPDSSLCSKTKTSSKFFVNYVIISHSNLKYFIL